MVSRAVGVVLVPIALVMGPAFRAEAAGLTAVPFTETDGAVTAPDGGPPAEARWERLSGESVLFLAKKVATQAKATAGVWVVGVRGVSTTGLAIGFRVVDGLCTREAPRFEIHLARAGFVRLGCADADVVGGSRRFVSDHTYGTVRFPSADTVESLAIVFDVGPAPVLLGDIRVGSQRVGRSPAGGE